MTTILTRDGSSDYDNHDRRADDEYGGDRWRRYVKCRDADWSLFFPEDQEGVEPAYPPPEAKRICDHCEVRSRCLTAHMNEEYGIYGGMTGFQRGLLTKKIVRKRCPGCTSEDVVTENKKEFCLACGVSWDVI